MVNEEYKSSSCHKIRNDSGEIIGDVCALPSKDIGGKDISFMPNEGQTKPMRSVAEFMNNLEEMHVPISEREEAADFLSERLRAIDDDFRDSLIWNAKKHLTRMDHEDID
jgi:hypothetical protein